MRTIHAMALLALLAAPVSGEEIHIEGTEIVSGAAPQITVEGLEPGDRVRVHSIRMFEVWEPDSNGDWRPVARPLHAWGDFLANATGIVSLRVMSPLAGTYAGTDAYGLLWSGRVVPAQAQDTFLPGTIAIADMSDGEGQLIVTREDRTLASEQLRFRDPPSLRIVEVAQGRLNGTFAAPQDGERHPVVILLHGSEGGSPAAAAALANRFAGQGYAAFAFNYFAWDLANLEGVPNAHVNQPIEMLAAVRDWMAAQPESDVERLGVYGHSKGAEYAALAAVRLPWIDAVAACVPTDVVWQGYGIGDGRNRSNPFGEPPELYSSFSWEGQPLPYIPLEGDRRPYHSNTDFYEAKRVEAGQVAEAAAIAVEQSSASFLWLGGGRDEVWASGQMARSLDARMQAAGEAARSELVVYDGAGHAICGDGTYPTRLWQSDSEDQRDPDLDANGRATVDGWERIVEFFGRKLRGGSG